MKNYDVIVFGGGNSIDVVRICGTAGMKLALVEEGPLGGTCPNRGCIPSKLFIAYAEVAEHVRNADRFHITAGIESIDREAIRKETLDYVGKFDGLLEDGIPDGVDLYRGHGTFVDNHTLQVGDQEITAPRIVISTGSRPRRLDLEVPYWTSDEVFQMERIPDSITILGGGYVGCELAYFFHGVGVDTLLVHRGHKLLEREDEEVQAVFQAGFPVPTALNTGLDELDREAEVLLLAVGRVPNTDRIGIENTDLEPNAQGYIDVDMRLRTAVEGVYALGDVIGRYAFTHAASFEAKWLADQLVHDKHDEIDYGPMPHAVFSSPEVAGVGKTEQQLRADGTDYRSASIPYTGVTKGRAIKEEHGLCKFLIDPAGKIFGCHIVGAHASVLLHEVLPFMKLGGDIHDIANLIHVHPSLPEVVRGAARKAAEKLTAG